MQNSAVLVPRQLCERKVCFGSRNSNSPTENFTAIALYISSLSQESKSLVRIQFSALGRLAISKRGA